MKKLILALVLILLSVPAFAQQFNWRYQSSADCSALTAGKFADLCYDTAKKAMFKCVPATGDCDTAGEWVQTAYSKDEIDASLALKADQSSLTAHTGNTSNPHSVTKSQVGLGNVDNTSDVNKPISTAVQTALDGKQPIGSYLTSESDPIASAKIGTLTNTKWCNTDGTKINCNQNAPALTETDPVWSLDKSLYQTTAQADAKYLQSESDPVWLSQKSGYVPTSRKINGQALTGDITIDGMVYPSSGIPTSTGSSWGTSIANNSSNWDTAYGWGNHASAGYLTAETDPVWSSDKSDYYTATQIDQALYIQTEVDPVYSAWDKDYADLINQPDLSIYLTDALSDGKTYGRKDGAWAEVTTTETDPVYSAWIASNPTSGTNTGDQDISGKVNTDQTTPQTMTGSFTFPTVHVGSGTAQSLGESLVVSDATRTLSGAQQPTKSLFLGSASGTVDRLAHFDNNQYDSRTEVTFSNSGNGSWTNNFVSFMVHGENFGGNYYFTDKADKYSDGGWAYLLAQGTYGGVHKGFGLMEFDPLPMLFGTDAKTRMEITGSTGNVLIGNGIDDETSKLQISTTKQLNSLAFDTRSYGDTKGYFGLWDATTLQLAINRRMDGQFSNPYASASSINMVGVDGAGYIGFYTSNQNGVDPSLAMQIQPSGNVSIGTASDDTINKLQVNGGIRQTSVTTNGFVKYTNDDGTLAVDTTSYEPAITTGTSSQFLKGDKSLDSSVYLTTGYVDRGNTAVYDFTITSFTKDGAWHDLDLSGIVPAGAVAVNVEVTLNCSTAYVGFYLKKKGNANDINIAYQNLQLGRTLVMDATVSIDSNRFVRYKADTSASWGVISLVVKGWWL